MAQIVVFMLIAAAIVVVWVLGARYVGVLAGLRDQDEDEWFRTALLITPFLAFFLLISRTPPPRGPR